MSTGELKTFVFIISSIKRKINDLDNDESTQSNKGLKININNDWRKATSAKSL